MLPRCVAKYIIFPGIILYVQTSHCLPGMLATCSCTSHDTGGSYVTEHHDHRTC